MITSIQTVLFKRGDTQEQANSNPTERGLLLNEGVLPIIDSNGHSVEAVWSYDTYHGLAIFDLEIGEPKEDLDTEMHGEFNED